MLTKWLAGAHAGHPLLRPEMPGWFLDTLELIVAPVDAAGPLRLPTKIKAFRTLTTDAELLEQRAELLAGSMLAFRSSSGRTIPTTCSGNQALGIEVGSRALDGPWALHDRLEELLAASGSDVSVQLSFDDRPLKLGAERIEKIAQAIAAHPMNQPTASMRFGDVGLSAQLTRGAGILVSRVSVTFAGGSASTSPLTWPTWNARSRTRPRRRPGRPARCRRSCSWTCHAPAGPGCADRRP